MDEEDKLIENPQLPPKIPKANSLYIVFKYVAIGSGILGIGLLFAFIGFFLAKNNSGKQQTTQITQKPVITKSPTYAPKNLNSIITDTNIPKQKLYTNPKYGLSFMYSTNSLGEQIDLKEVGNKIYIYDAKFPYSNGQYVEVFQKSSGDSLDTAIKKKFLTNIPEKDCYVKVTKADALAKFPTSYQIRTLGFPVTEGTDEPWFARSNMCPSIYAQTNGLSYFLGDSLHPSIYLFFSIGQYGIQSGDPSESTWQDTIKFLD